ncbi:MAG: hypothetical protein K2M19_00895 [Muribaculaceae bacterium]|nr:hypothetical protein [Muribaculaceae bacterium]
MKKSILVSLFLFTVLMVCGRSIIMKIEMKDGTVRYLDTEQIDEFNFLMLDSVPTKPVDRYLTEDMWTGAVWYHDSTSVFSASDRQVRVTDRYIPNEPVDHQYAVYGWGKDCRSAKFYLDAANNLTVPCQRTGYVHPEYGEIWLADRQSYCSDVDSTATFEIKPCKWTGVNFNLELVYYTPGTDFAKPASELLMTPGMYCMNINPALPQKVGDEFVWKVTLEDQFGILKQVAIDYACNDTDNFYSSDKYRNLYDNFDTNAKTLVFKDGKAELTVKSARIDCPIVFVAALVDRDGVRLSDRPYEYYVNMPMGLEFAPSHTITYGNMSLQNLFSGITSSQLDFVAADEASATAPKLRLNIYELYCTLDITFPQGITPDKNGRIPVAMAPQSINYPYTYGEEQAQIMTATIDEWKKHIKEATGQDVDVEYTQSYYDPERMELVLYNIYFLDIEPDAFFTVKGPEFFSPTRTLEDLDLPQAVRSLAKPADGFKILEHLQLNH